MDRAVPASPTIDAPVRGHRRWWQWGGSFLTVSILLHLLLGVGAVYLIVQKITSRGKATFTAASAPSAPAAASREHKAAGLALGGGTEAGNPSLGRPVSLSDADRELLGKHLPLECLRGPSFKSTASSTTDTLFNH